ncbi:MAG: type 1 glutamine amidotransferase-like domain-containing protein [Candidatus Moranbacteria bacterium]|nr:type 1 glutamine amidotransferase-like domain-containing protein [Candidatus Moranbacteria bacterium]NTW45867.1 type 1 glutamine amidotransferase-like domain-containing protein [Candidatus Moranbacteria bacterium]
MKLYLSSYKLGNDIEALKGLVPAGNRKTAFIPNALDFSTDSERREKSERSDVEDLSALGLEVERLDLRDYFGLQSELETKLGDFGVIWVRGGNAFVLRKAMKKSGFDEILRRFVGKKELLYGGYSAGICVLSPTLEGIDLVDDPYVDPYGDPSAASFEGLGIVDYSIVPHYRSDHPESASIEKVVEYLEEKGIRYRTLRDGDVIISEVSEESAVRV